MTQHGQNQTDYPSRKLTPRDRATLEAMQKKAGLCKQAMADIAKLLALPVTNTTATA